MIHLVLGGARSGKSRRAVALAARTRRVFFVATAQRSDGEMRRRIAAHQAERPRRWKTVEAPRRTAEALTSVPRGATVILDCVTLMIGRLVADRMSDALVLAAVDRLITVARKRNLRVIAVSNEVGSGVVPPTRLGRRFQDLLGAANARLAAAAVRVELLVAGIPVRVKG